MVEQLHHKVEESEHVMEQLHHEVEEPEHVVERLHHEVEESEHVVDQLHLEVEESEHVVDQLKEATKKWDYGYLETKKPQSPIKQACEIWLYGAINQRIYLKTAGCAYQDRHLFF